MKKQFSILVVSTVIIGLILSLFGMVLVSRAESAGKAQAPATNVRIVKKVLPSLTAEETKGNPFGTPPGKDKDENKGAATGVLGEPLAEGASKYAIITGICNYPGTANDIGDCKSDGDSLNMYKALTELYGYDSNNIYLFKDMGMETGFGVTAGVPTRGNIQQAIDEIKNKAASIDEVVFFFSGHGANGIAEDGDDELTDEAIVVHKDNGTDLDADIDYIWDGELKSWFNDFGVARIVFIFDICLAGGMNDLADTGRVVVMSTQENQSAYVYSTGEYDIDRDGIKDGEGVFSRLFVNKGMLQDLADKYDSIANEPDVAVEEAFDYAKENIPSRLKRKQKPVISDSFEDDLLL